MKYLKYLFVAGIVMLATSSYTTRTSRISEGVYPGNLIPDFEIKNELGNELKLSDMKGQKVLVSLWAAYDAESHMQNVLLWNTLKKGNHPIKMISVSFDPSKAVVKNTLSMDGIENEFQCADTLGRQSKIYKKYRLERGFENYLVDESGMIIAKNVSPSELNNLLVKN